MTCSGKYICITFVISLVWFVIGGILATILMHLFYCNCDRAHQLASSNPSYNYDKDAGGKKPSSQAPGDEPNQHLEMTTGESLSTAELFKITTGEYISLAEHLELTTEESISKAEHLKMRTGESISKAEHFKMTTEEYISTAQHPEMTTEEYMSTAQHVRRTKDDVIFTDKTTIGDSTSMSQPITKSLNNDVTTQTTRQASSEPTYNYDKDQQGKEMWSTAPGYLSTTDRWEEDVEMTTQESISMSNPTTRSGKNDISTRSTRQAACPLGSINLGNSCYRFDTKQTRTKYEAAEYCASYQSSLVAIESQSEQDFLVNHIKESKVIPANIQDKDWDIINAYSYWTGLTDWAVTDVYRWDASGEVANFTAWSWFQPNSVDGHCVLLYAQHPDLLWNDISCDKKASTICEADIIMC